MNNICVKPQEYLFEKLYIPFSARWGLIEIELFSHFFHVNVVHWLISCLSGYMPSFTGTLSVTI